MSDIKLPHNMMTAGIGFLSKIWFWCLIAFLIFDMLFSQNFKSKLL